MTKLKRTPCAALTLCPGGAPVLLEEGLHCVWHRWNDNELTCGAINHMREAISRLVLCLLGIALKVGMHAKAFLEHRQLDWIHKAEICPICSAREALRRQKDAKELQSVRCATMCHGTCGADTVPIHTFCFTQLLAARYALLWPALIPEAALRHTACGHPAAHMVLIWKHTCSCCCKCRWPAGCAGQATVQEHVAQTCCCFL